MIFENEDDVGYWAGPSNGGYPRNPRYSDYHSRHPMRGSLAICNAILTSQERANIEWAAAFEDNDEPAEAAQCRVRAGYGGC